MRISAVGCDAVRTLREVSISAVTMHSTNSNNSYAGNGDDVILSFVSNVPLDTSADGTGSTVTFKTAGSAAAAPGIITLMEGLQYQAVLQISSSVALLDGVMSFQLMAYDQTGSFAEPISTLSSGLAVTLGTLCNNTNHAF